MRLFLLFVFLAGALALLSYDKLGNLSRIPIGVAAAAVAIIWFAVLRSNKRRPFVPKPPTAE